MRFGGNGEGPGLVRAQQIREQRLSDQVTPASFANRLAFSLWVLCSVPSKALKASALSFLYPRRIRRTGCKRFRCFVGHST